ncbi:Sec-independent protein translocase subunit TatA/TatB [Cytophaga hutchinsonii]|jgi:sec-independent protein translocase protein TatA|uniref:Sec-independent protein translocase protein TatA n=1 Tax=Cytophaga hutchinsonii (strain ATCC 33406 / DSM 1761 / CIP 103989 / NBRC 15051 / NCIMB 9469 / D465) TaxID=269798 RepID=A0A6N4SQT2_CYTH3|nr:twin-arginine translocase TatA/TatE family subunit [Cytophaga hutchinsonii]ABG58730.1 sec-independent protein translocase [Cytophaga hutchinsonii ATCC 33406]SFX60585.1 sec-independent protein translocase protein TatA [Cytophaga hutchinsonii ATCC 33406]
MLGSVLLIMGLGGGEIALIMFAVVLLFGAKKIPELAKGLGQGIREFKDASSEVKSEINKSIEKDV